MNSIALSTLNASPVYDFYTTLLSLCQVQWNQTFSILKVAYPIPFCCTCEKKVRAAGTFSYIS